MNILEDFSFIYLILNLIGLKKWVQCLMSSLEELKNMICRRDYLFSSDVDYSLKIKTSLTGEISFERKSK